MLYGRGDKVPVPNRFHAVINSVVEMLVENDYSALERNGQNGRLSGAELRAAVKKYGRRLAKLPVQAFELAGAVEIESQRGTWIVDVPLWTVEEGRSDLTLLLTIFEADGKIAATVDDLHVL